MSLPETPDETPPRVDTSASWGPSTRAVTAGRVERSGPLSTSISTATTWASRDLDEAHQRARSARPADFYSRYANPTVTELETAIAELENAPSALAMASGMGALATVLFALCSTGDHVVASRQLYAGTRALLEGPAARMGIETTFVDGTDATALAAAVRPGRTMVVMAETPSNPCLDLVDLDALGALSGPFTVVDSTFATPIGQRPLDHGVDLVVHSATKGLGGHNDATLGVVAGDGELLDAIWGYGVLHGATPSPYDAAAVLRGLRTLAIRFERQNSTALAVVAALSDHPAVAALVHPHGESHPQRDLARRQLAGCSMLALDLNGGTDAARRFEDHLRLCRVATSLGGPDTLVSHAATSTHSSLDPNERRAQGIGDGLMRVSIGLEDPEDLIADIRSALDATAR